MICGLILNGGRSARMGFDKGELNFHGKPQRLFLAELLTKFCDEVYVSVKSEIPALDIPILPDKFEIESPLNGILSAFEYRNDSAWLTVPVDMPGIDEKIISILISGRDKNSLATCFTDEDREKPEPLVAIWEAHAYPLLKQFFESGKISPREFLMNGMCKILPSPGSNFHKNINSPEEMRMFRQPNHRE